MFSIWSGCSPRKAVLAFTCAALVLLAVACAGTPAPITISPPNGAPSPIALAVSTNTPAKAAVPAAVTVTPTSTTTPVIGAVEATPAATYTDASPETWTGTIHSETDANYGAAGACSGEAWDMKFDLSITPDGHAAGSGSGTLASMPQCSGSGFKYDYKSKQAHNVGFSVSGAKTDKAFDLQFSETKIDGSTVGLLNYALLLQPAHVILHIPLTSPTTAQVQSKVDRTIDIGSVSAQHQVSMQCTNCR